ncbi:MAG: FixH family protein [Bacillus sp. (in: firmicutes)]
MKKGIILLLGCLLLAGCSNGSISKNEPEVSFLDVDLTIDPEKAEVNQEIVFQAKVTYGDKPVTDADEVKFEIWRSKSDNSEVVEVEHAGDGIYRLSKRIDVEGTYYIYAHVTAEGMHNMPKEEFTVGEPSEPETKDDSEKEHMEEMESHSH